MMGAHPTPHSDDRVCIAAAALVVSDKRQICSQQFHHRWDRKAILHRPAQHQITLKSQSHTQNMLQAGKARMASVALG